MNQGTRESRMGRSALIADADVAWLDKSGGPASSRDAVIAQDQGTCWGPAANQESK